MGGRLPYLPSRLATGMDIRAREGQWGHSSGEGVIVSNTSGAQAGSLNVWGGVSHRDSVAMVSWREAPTLRIQVQVF